MSIISGWKQKASLLRVETYALYLAYKDPRVPLYVKILLLVIIGYAFSPIDLIPDFIPVFGYIDDLIIIPAGILLAIKMIPKEILEECRAKAKTIMVNSNVRWVGVLVIISLWILIAVIAGVLIWKISS